jgi:hypothetical protein
VNLVSALHPQSCHVLTGSDDCWYSDFSLRISGSGIYTYSNGDKYEGEWQHNMYHASGLLVKVDKRKHGALGLKWKEAGSEKPSAGTEIKNEFLAAALQKKIEFKKEEWEDFQVANLSSDSYIKAGNCYFKPADGKGQEGGTSFFKRGAGFSMYRGEFRKGQRHGSGSLTFPRGELYVVILNFTKAVCVYCVYLLYMQTYPKRLPTASISVWL